MESIQYTILRDLIAASPDIPEVLVHTNATPRVDGQTARRDDAEIAGILNNPAHTRIVETRVTDLSLMDALGVTLANGILDKLTAAGATNSAIRRAMKAIESERGIDIGNDEVRGMLDQLVAGGVITLAESDALKALAVKPCGIAEQTLGAPVSGADVSIALRGV
jgi:hypothetical protein